VRHVRPHEWADVDRGAVDAGRRARMEAHADDCDACARARDRVRQTRETFARIRVATPPQLNWEHVGARIYWVTSSERRANQRKPPRPRPRAWLLAAGAFGLAASVGVAYLFFTRGPAGSSGSAPEVAAVQPAEPAPTRTMSVQLVAPPAAQPLRGVITFSQGAVTRGGERLDFDSVIAPGDRLATGADGTLTVQFGSATGFTLGPRSSIELRSFDQRHVAIALDGQVTVEVEHRADDQRFEVLAGDAVVSVRGTVFRVEHRDSELEVACARGVVEVARGGGEHEVAAGHTLSLAAGDQLAGRTPADLTAAARETLERNVAVRLLPAWTDVDGARATSATLRLAATGDQPIEVDGEVVGQGSFRARVMSGRHHVETGEGRGSWIRLEPGADEVAELAPAAPPPSTRQLAHKAERTRRGQLDRALGHGRRVRPCLRQLEKQGLLDGSFVVLDLGVNRDGSLGYLNVAQTNLPAQAAACVRTVVDAARLPDGPSAELRYRIAF